MEPIENGQEAKLSKITLNRSDETTRLLKNSVIDGLEELCALYCRDMNPAWIPIWVEALSDMNPETIQGKFLEVKRTFQPTSACPFPTPAHLRNLAIKAEDESQRAAAEGAWQFVMDAIRRDYQGDIGWMSRKNPIEDARALEAVKAAGGFDALNEAPDRELVWRKKEFIMRFEQLRDWTPPPPKQLPASVQDLVKELPWTKDLTGMAPAPESYLAKNTAAPLSFIKVMTDEEWEAYKTEQKQKLAEWCKKNGKEIPII